MSESAAAAPYDEVATIPSVAPNAINFHTHMNDERTQCNNHVLLSTVL